MGLCSFRLGLGPFGGGLSGENCGFLDGSAGSAPNTRASASCAENIAAPAARQLGMGVLFRMLRTLIVAFSAAGFGASTTETVIVGSATFQFRTTATGSFTARITIPAGAAGNTTITARPLPSRPPPLFVWFHLQKEADWRINSSDSCASALRNALLARRS